MKKTVFAAIVLLPGFSFAQSQNNITKVPLDESGIGYQFPECMRAGPVCELFPKDSSPTNSKVMAYKSNTNILVIEISKDLLTEEKQLAIMGKLLKDVQENEEIRARIDMDFPLSSELLRALNIDTNLSTIKAGNYPVKIVEQHILLQFELTSK